MTDPSYIILYVDNPQSSADFYGDLLKKEPVEYSPTFAMFALDSGFMFGLWSKHKVEPQSQFEGSGCEVAFTLKSKSELENTLQKWKAKGLTILQEITSMDFGETFTALDADGHRLRVFVPQAP